MILSGASAHTTRMPPPLGKNPVGACGYSYYSIKMNLCSIGMLKIEKMKEFWIIKISVFLCRQVHGVPQEAHCQKKYSTKPMKYQTDYL